MHEKDEQDSEDHNGRHICTLDSDIALVFQPDQHLSSMQHTIQLWRGNPNAKHFYRNLKVIEEEIKWNRFIIHPFSFFSFTWEAIQLMILFTGFIVIPLNMIFGPMIKPGVVQLGISNFTLDLEICCDCIYLLDVIRLLITGYPDYVKGKVYMTYHLIFRKYIKSKMFYVDLASVLNMTLIIKMCTDLISMEENVSWIIYLKLCSLLKFMRIVRFLRYYKGMTTYAHHYFYTVEAIKYTLLGFIVLHCLTCLNIMMEQYLLVYANKSDLILHSDEDALFVTLPYGVMYLTGVQSIIFNLFRSQIASPYSTNNSQTLWSYHLAFFFVVSILGFILNCILLMVLVHLIVMLNASERRYHAMLNQVRHYFSYKQLPKQMQIKIFALYDYRFKKGLYNERILAEKLPESFIEDINMFSCRNLIETVPVFQGLPQATLSQIRRSLECKIFSYGDTIIKAGDSDDCMYFILSGTVAISTASGHEICHLQDGAYFGEIALLIPGRNRVANVVAIEMCETYCLERQSFLKCFDETSTVYRKLEQAARQRLEKTVLFENMHKKFLLDRTTKASFKKSVPIQSHFIIDSEASSSDIILTTMD